METFEPIIGSMLWVTPQTSDAELHRSVQSMLRNGLSIARLFFPWDWMEPEENRYDFSVTDRIFRVCEEHGLFVTPTLMGAANPPYLAKVECPKPDAFGYCQARREACVKKIVERYRNSPVLHSWILWNEPEYHVPLNAEMLLRFRCWLKEGLHGDESLLEARYRSIMGVSETVSFDAVGTVLPDGGMALPGVTTDGWAYPARIDWANFEEHCLIQILSGLQKAVKNADPDHPTSVNVAGLIEHGPANGGRDLYHIGRVVDFLAASCHPSWHSARFSLRRIDQSVSMICDLVRSATTDPNGRFYLTELQSGTNFYSGHRPMSPTGDDIRHWLWEAIGTGCRGMIYWLFESRPGGFEGLEWGLMNQLGNPSERSRASAEVATLLLEHRNLFERAVPKPFDLYIYHSYPSATLSSAERPTRRQRDSDLQNPRNAEMINDAKCGAYLLAQDCGLDAGFVSAEDFDGTLPSDAKILLVPHCYSMEENEVERMVRFVEAGGTLIADGLFAVKDHCGNRVSDKTRELVGRLFSAPVDDWTVSTEPFSFQTDAGLLPAWFLKCIWESPDNVQVLAKDEMGNAVAVSHACGKGRAVLIGTQFFQFYFAKDGEVPEYRAFFKDLLPAFEQTFTLCNPSTSLRMKQLQTGQSHILIFYNRENNPQSAILQAQEGCALYDLQTGETLSAGAKQTEIALKSKQVRVFAVL